MLLQTPEVFVVIFIWHIHLCRSQWIWANHGKPPVYSGLNHMQSGSNPKLFGVGNGKLQERYWSHSSNQWIWANHGAPWGLLQGERLASDPCIMEDGQVFIISNKGRLFHRYWRHTVNSWAWAIHGKAMGNQLIRTSGCTCMTHASVKRVFVLGYNGKLYERYWSWSSNSWVWRYHGSPPGTSYVRNIDSSPTGDSVYVVGGNQVLYSRFITPANPGIASWVTRGRPPGNKPVWSVTANSGGVFITTYFNDICEYKGATIGWSCYGKPSGSINRSASISKAFAVTNCSKLPGSAKYIFVYSWDPISKSRGRLFSLKINIGTYSVTWKYHGNIGRKYYIHSPELFMSGTCPKVFTVRSDGYVYERYVQ